MAASKNVLLIVVDTLRCDHMSGYGYWKPTSPRLDRFAADAVRFESCISHAPWTIPSFTSILSGRDPIHHRVVASPWNIPNHPHIGFDDTMPTLAEMMREAGYETLAVDNLIEMLSHPSWFVRGFHQYVNLTDRLGLRHHHVLGEQITDAFLAWQPIQRDRPWFAFLHYWDPHTPYNYPRSYDPLIDAEPPAAIEGAEGRPYLPLVGYSDEVDDWRLELVAEYDRSIRYADDAIGRLLDELGSRGVLDDTVVVFSGDHGEAMVEHGVEFNHSLLYEPTVHVPLIVRDPESRQTGVVSDVVQHIDLTPTLLRLCGIEGGERFPGYVLPPWAEGDPARPFAVSCQDGGAALRSLRTRDWKLICRYRLGAGAPDIRREVDSVELYDLAADPYELHDVSATRSEVRDDLLQRLEAWCQREQGDAASDPLVDPGLHVDFDDFPGDPVLAEFYRSLRDNPAKAR